MLDPIWRLAGEITLQRRAEDWLQLQIELQSHSGWLVTMMIKARDEAADALQQLAIVDPEDPKKIRELQNNVRRFDDLVGWIRALMQEGMLADELLRQENNQDIGQYVDEEGRFEAEELGLVNEGTHDA